MKKALLVLLGVVLCVALYLGVYNWRTHQIDREVQEMNITDRSITALIINGKSSFEEYIKTAKSGDTFKCDITLSDGTKETNLNGYVVNGDENGYYLEGNIVKISKGDSNVSK